MLTIIQAPTHGPADHGGLHSVPEGGQASLEARQEAKVHMAPFDGDGTAAFDMPACDAQAPIPDDGKDDERAAAGPAPDGTALPTIRLRFAGDPT